MPSSLISLNEINQKLDNECWLISVLFSIKFYLGKEWFDQFMVYQNMMVRIGNYHVLLNDIKPRNSLEAVRRALNTIYTDKNIEEILMQKTTPYVPLGNPKDCFNLFFPKKKVYNAIYGKKYNWWLPKFTQDIHVNENNIFSIMPKTIMVGSLIKQKDHLVSIVGIDKNSKIIIKDPVHTELNIINPNELYHLFWINMTA